MGAHWWQRGVIYRIYPRSFQDNDSVGDFVPLKAEGDVLAYQRCLEDDAMIVALNPGDRPQHFSLPAGIGAVVPPLSTLPHLPICGSGTVALEPHRGAVLEVRR